MKVDGGIANWGDVQNAVMRGDGDGPLSTLFGLKCLTQVIWNESHLPLPPLNEVNPNYFPREAKAVF